MSSIGGLERQVCLLVGLSFSLLVKNSSMKVHKSCCPPTLDHLKNPLPPLNHMEKLIPPLHPLLTKHYHYVLLKYVHTFVIIQGKLEVWISLPVLYWKKKKKVHQVLVLIRRWQKYVVIVARSSAGKIKIIYRQKCPPS